MTEPQPAHPLTPYPPLLVNAALTGMLGRRADVPHLPVTTEQIARDAWIAHQLGAAIIHLHLRASDERPDWRPEPLGPREPPTGRG